MNLARSVPLAVLLAFGIGIVPAEASEPRRDAALHALFDEAWESDLREDPLRATYLGDRRYDAQWPDLSPAGIERRYERYRSTLERLRAIDRSRLGPEDELSRELFERELGNRLATYPFKPWLYEPFSRDGLHTLSETAELVPFDGVRDYENWIARLASVDRYLAQNIVLMETGIREKRVPPRVILERVGPRLDALLAGSLDENPFYAPFTRMPESLAASERERLRAAGKRAVADVVLPAYRRLDAFFRERYLPASRATAGIWDTPYGEAYYRERAAYHTTTTLTPEEIHRIGLREVARIRAEMEAIIRRVEFKGSFAEFLIFLRTDPQFYFESPDELFHAYLVTSKRIDPELVKLFRTMPRAPYGVRAIPATSAPNTTTAYYQGPAMDGTRPGYYYVNLYRPEVRPKYEIEVLTVHEAVPGHHFQIALAMEQARLPRFRRNAGFTAYVEGWALYTETLGEELGLYKDPYSKFGQLTYDMWRAVRLVVDTGLHHKRWTRAQAIDYFKANAAKTEADIVNEIDRYIAWPGQALAYKIGQLEILKLRREAEEKLGGRFDIRAFHDAVLATGAVPLDVLGRTVRSWIASQRNGGETEHRAGVAPARLAR
jgi:uncharacterized protein (DUF885 family)